MNHHNLYFIANEMVLKLNVIFETYDKIVKSNAEFHDFNFVINVKDKKKSFETFYARFNAIIVSLNYTNILKIFNLKRLINTRLRYRISNENYISFRDFIAHLRYIVVNLKIIDKTFSNKNNKSEND